MAAIQQADRVAISLSRSCMFCKRSFSSGDAFFQCADCRDDKASACKSCILGDYEDHGHNLQPCCIDPRDEWITWLAAPSPDAFRELVGLAQSVDTFQFPYSVKTFLLGKTDNAEELPGLSAARLNNFVEAPDSEQETARTRKIQNDYSLYEPLDYEKREIRMALLLPATGDAPLNLGVVRMAYPWTQRNYTALSYTWGPLDETRPIYIGHAVRKVGQEEQEGLRDQVFGCTANLEIALRALRRTDTFLALWIDALCINQADPEERAYQVGIMQEIYANSAAVCSWLNLSKKDAMAMQVIGALGSEAEKARNGPAKSWSEVQLVRHMLQNGQFISSGSEGTVGIPQVVKMLSSFFENPYFRRVWVLQEVWSARHEVVVLGKNAPGIGWEHILFAHLFVSVAFRNLRMRVSGLIQPWQQFEKDAQNASFQRLPILHLFEGVLQEFEATDVRDKVFGLLAMGQETYDIRNLPALIAPNYNKTTSQVFVDFTKWCITISRSLDVLGYVTYANRSETGDVGSLPTWSLSPVSEFRDHGEKLTEVEDFHAAADIPLAEDDLIRIANTEKTLQLSGYQLDTIQKAGTMYFTTRWYDSSDLYMMNGSTNTYYSGGLKYIWSQIGWRDKRARECSPLKEDFCTCQAMLDTLLTTLTTGGMRRHAGCDHTRGIHRTKWLKPTDMYADFAAHWVHNQTVDPDNGGDQEMHLFCDHVRGLLLPLAEKGAPDKFSELLQNASRRKFALTVSGKVGLVPVGTEDGDIVVALFGGRAPFVLRKVDVVGDGDATHAWSFVGECYVSGYMNGQYVKKKLEADVSAEVFQIH